MPIDLARQARRVGARLKPALDATVGLLVAALLRLVRLTDPDRIARFGGRVLRRAGPWLPENRIGRANLTAAYPEKSAAEIDAILAGVWENLGCVGAEYAHLDRLWDFDPTSGTPGRIEVEPKTHAQFCQVRDDGKPGLLFSAHVANWEMAAVAAAGYGLHTTILYRPPNIGDVAKAIERIRAVNMGDLVPTTPQAAFRMAAALERGSHAAMLVDQHYARGVEVMFFGRPCKVNPMLARLARHFDCPIHGVRMIRLPGHRFRADITPPIEPARTPDGQVDIAGTMQIITTVVEGWIREYPEQWLWLHRRWR